ncbi:hypothetical protein PVAND_006579 [Polypedilum vanderplanki]|uniref:Cuticle protein n=1 Tax=Polypedilum vanderplanki TaxID=319348 RepID=A0A9J6C435_POLVA|nr:hypothetical protein PVAND_006579 [Polypedilum vanderplanki]
MIRIIVLCLALNITLGQKEKAMPEILRQEINHNGDNGYNFDIETSDGSKFEERGDFKYKGGLTVRGSYEFVDDDGKVHKVVYEADERGFRPTILD